MNILYGQFGKPGIRNCDFETNHRAIKLDGCKNMYLSNNVYIYMEYI